MRRVLEGFNSFLRLLVFGLLMAMASNASAQGPQVDVEDPPGASNARGGLGPSLGASGTSAFDVNPVTTQDSLFGGRPGPSVTRVPLDQLSSPTAAIAQPKVKFKPQVLEAAETPSYGQLEEPNKPENPGPANGLTLDGAIARLIDQNLNLMALKFEIPMGQADVLTASLRANPIFYADSQLVPYGHYSNARPGGQTQYDVNITYPVDIWRKRKARTHVAEAAQRVTEAQFQDAVRLQIDNLYTAFVDVSAASTAVEYSKAYVMGLEKILKVNLKLLEKEQIKEADLLVTRAQLEQAQLQVYDSVQALQKARRTLGLLLNMPRQEADSLQLRATLRNVRPLPLTDEDLTRLAMTYRPDLNGMRLGLHRAQADVKLAYANRYSDVYLLLQPYTLQNNSPLGLKSAYSYAVGATVSLPIYNRNQGNIARSKLNVTQTQIELVNAEKQVSYDVDEAVREFKVSLTRVNELEREVLPASRKVRNTAYERWLGGETNIIDYFEAQRSYNETVKGFRDALVRHRRAMLDLNTAVGTRVLP